VSLTSRAQVTTFMSSATWREQAACKEVLYPEIFDLPGAKVNKGYLQAKSLCSRCKVSKQCYAWARADHSFEGIAGGHVWRGSERKGVCRTVVPC
jgi:hypothetical protein